MALTRITKGVIKPNENYDTHNINSTGIVTAIGLDVNGNGDISGNLNVGGVLTYEDVTSIDSVGIITARDGIHVGAGVSAVGVGTFSGLDISGDIDVDGHTNLDNVSVAGVTTFSGILDAVNTPASIRVAQDIQHKGDANTKITFPANDNISFNTAGNERLRIAANGTIGIGGTTIPGALLDLSSTAPGILFSETGVSANNGKWLNQANASELYWQALTDAHSGGGNLFKMTRSAQQIQSFEGQQAGATWFTIRNSDKTVGIGTDNPTTNLQVNDASNESTISLYNAGTKKVALQASNNFGSILYSYDDEPLIFSVHSGSSFSEKLRINSSGEVSIGTDSGGKTLTLYGALSSSLRISKSGVLAYDHTFDGSTYTIANNNGSAGIPIVIGTKTAGGEALRIDAYGRVLIGGTSAIIGSSSAFNEIVLTGKTRGAGITLQDVDANVRFQIRTDDDSSGTLGTLLNASTNHDIFFRTNNTERLRITSAGTLQVQGDGNAYLSLGRYTNDDKGSRVRFIKSRNTTFGSNTIVQDGDTLGTIDFYGSESNSAIRGSASISAEVDGTPGSADMPGRLVFRTVPDNSTTLTERLRITSDGDLSLRTTTQNAFLGLRANSTAINFTLGSSAGTSPRMYLYGTGNGQSTAGDIFMGAGTGGIVNIRSGGLIKFEVNSDNSTAEALRITAGGDVKISTAGKGIDFSANTALSGASNVSQILDHYEEGTYVPTWSGATNPTTYRNGIDSGTNSNGLSYVRIGKQVTVTGGAFWSGASINNTRPYMSLPFPARRYSVSGTIGNYSLGVNSEVHYLNYDSTTSINFFVQTSGGGHGAFGDNSNGEMYFDITYMTY